MSQTQGSDWSRLVHVLLVCVVAFAAFLLGTRHLEYEQQHDKHTEAPRPSKAATAKTYGDLLDAPYTANKASLSTLEELRKGGATAPNVKTRSAEQMAQGLSKRAKRRAFAGAPPVVPHPVKQRGGQDCLSCHRQGIEIGGKVAPAMSHEEYPACTQCHVPAAAPQPGAKTDDVEPPLANSFVPLLESPHGERAYDGAPPTIPHSTHMRENCASCHGEMGLPVMRTSHPERTACTQCHVPSAVLDQRGPMVPFPAMPERR